MGKEGPVGAAHGPQVPNSQGTRERGRVSCGAEQAGGRRHMVREQTERVPRLRGAGLEMMGKRRTTRGSGVAGARFPGGDIRASWRLCSGPLGESGARRGTRVELRGTGVTG